MPANTQSPAIKSHQLKWGQCTACSLCHTRRNVVTYRGNTQPVDLLFIGEGPGQAEDVLGEPFVGPSGQLLTQIIEESIKSLNDGGTIRLSFTYGFTNVVCCLPLDSKGKIRKPKRDEMEACKERFLETLGICQPQGLVVVGDTAKEYVGGLMRTRAFQLVPWTSIKHPAAMLRGPSEELAPHRLIAETEIVNLVRGVVLGVPFS